MSKSATLKAMAQKIVMLGTADYMADAVQSLRDAFSALWDTATPTDRATAGRQAIRMGVGDSIQLTADQDKAIREQLGKALEATGVNVQAFSDGAITIEYSLKTDGSNNGKLHVSPGKTSLSFPTPQRVPDDPQVAAAKKLVKAATLQAEAARIQHSIH